MRISVKVMLAMLLISPSLAGQNQIKLMTDSMGIDFRPYLKEMLSAISTNLPGSSQPTIFRATILRNGKVSRLVLTNQSDDKVQDRVPETSYLMKVIEPSPVLRAPASATPLSAAAALLLASPFPPLPATFKGDSIDVQLALGSSPPR
jgi:hypothetical protein